VRIYLAGRLAIEAGDQLLDEGQLPARQGRIAFAYLVLERQRPIPRLELAEAIWGADVPEAWDAGLSALLSRLRRVFRDSAIEADIETLSGSASLSLPDGVWVDVEAARNALDEAEGLMRSATPEDAWGPAVVAFSITERGFLHGEELPWIVRERERQRAEHLRVLEVLSELSFFRGEPEAALVYARKSIEMEPFRESSYERMMRAQLKVGNRAEALRTYEKLRQLLADELGADPSPALQARYLEALRT
jgi:DNA-binding SARP family transcriptional activator